MSSRLDLTCDVCLIGFAVRYTDDNIGLTVRGIGYWLQEKQNFFFFTSLYHILGNIRSRWLANERVADPRFETDCRRNVFSP